MQFKTLVAALSFVIAAAAAPAQTVNIQFQATNNANPVYTGPGVLDPNSKTDTWNQVGNPTTAYTGMLSITGTATGESITTANFGSFAGGYNNGPAAELYNHFILGGTSSPNNPFTGTITFGGLRANTTYNVVFYGDNGNGADGSRFFDLYANGNQAGIEQLVNMDSSTGFVSTLSATMTADNGFPTYQGNYIAFSAASNASGNLAFTFISTVAEFDLGGASIQAVPEPSSMALFGGAIAATGCFFSRRMNKQA